MGWLSNKAAEALGEIAGRQTAEGIPAVKHPQNGQEAREASHQQVGYHKALDGSILRTEETQEAFDAGYVRGIGKGLRK